MSHRLAHPDETVAWVTPHREAMGITRVANITGLDRIGIPVVTVCRPNSRSLAVSQGKGATLGAARASGLMEAIELYHAEHVDQPIVWASHRQLRRSCRVADVRRLPRPRRSCFRPDQVIPWIEGRHLLDGRPVAAPYEMVHTDCRLPFLPGAGCFVSGSNGLASGNHRLEAILHGLCEVVERDATTLWYQRVENAGRIDLDSVDDPICRDVLGRYADARVSVAAWETTTDVGVPSYLCQIAEPAEERCRPVSGAHGMGCHPDRRVALLRALTEAAQCRLTWISGGRDDASPEDYDASPAALQLERESMAVRGRLRRFQSAPTFDGATVEEDLAWVLERLRAAGITGALWVDLTKPEFGIPVVRVIVPGLEPVGFGSSRSIYRPGARARRLRRQSRRA